MEQQRERKIRFMYYMWCFDFKFFWNYIVLWQDGYACLILGIFVRKNAYDLVLSNKKIKFLDCSKETPKML